jgi:hypothetical protein
MLCEAVDMMGLCKVGADEPRGATEAPHTQNVSAPVYAKPIAVTERELPFWLKRHNRTIAVFHSRSCAFCQPVLDIADYINYAYPHIPVLTVKCGMVNLKSVGYGVVAYPTVLLLHKEDMHFKYSEAYSWEAVVAWVGRASGVDAKPLPEGMVPVIREPQSYLQPDEKHLVIISGVVTVLCIMHVFWQQIKKLVPSRSNRTPKESNKKPEPQPEPESNKKPEPQQEPESIKKPEPQPMPEPNKKPPQPAPFFDPDDASCVD